MPTIPKSDRLAAEEPRRVDRAIRGCRLPLPAGRPSPIGRSLFAAADFTFWCANLASAAAAACFAFAEAVGDAIDLIAAAVIAMIKSRVEAFIRLLFSLARSSDKLITIPNYRHRGGET